MESNDTAPGSWGNLASNPSSTELNPRSPSSRTASLEETVPRYQIDTSQWEVQALQRTHTIGASPTSRTVSRASRRPLPGFGRGRPYPPALPVDREDYVVDFDGPTDPLHPTNWPSRTKILTATIAGSAAFTSTFASSIFSVATEALSQRFHVSEEVADLTTTLFLLGYGVGPSIWAPMSELLGRKMPLLISMFGFSIFAVGSAVAKDAQTHFICRFFTGVFGSSPVAVVAGMYSDMYSAENRGAALACFALTIFMGPMIAPFIGGFTETSYLGWRWQGYWCTILGFTSLFMMVFFMKETYPPTILVTKANELRRRTKNWAIHAKQEEVELELQELLQKNFARPLRMFFTEPIVFFVTIYLSFVYGLLYTFLTAYPLVFQGVHGFSPGVGGLPFLAMGIGLCLGALASVLAQPAWRRKYRHNHNRVVPEWRMPLAIVGGFAFAVGLFWFAWTGNYESVHWIVPTLSGLLTGFGLILIFVQLFLYLIDAYLAFAASTIAANTIVRSIFTAACPLYARQMFDTLTIKWAGSLLAFVALALTPVPILFSVYGERLLQKSHFSPASRPTHDEKASEDGAGPDHGQVKP